MVQLQLNFKNKIKNKTIEKSYTEGFEVKNEFYMYIVDWIFRLQKMSSKKKKKQCIK